MKSKKETQPMKAGTITVDYGATLYVCPTCAVLKEWIQGVESLGYKVAVLATLKAILKAAEPPPPKDEWSLAKWKQEKP